MSEQEKHICRIREVDIDPETYKKSWEDEHPGSDIDDTFWDDIWPKPLIVNGKAYEVIEDREVDELNEIVRCSDGTLICIADFYNGGTCLPEILEELLKNEM